jgi:hypothetical protein
MVGANHLLHMQWQQPNNKLVVPAPIETQSSPVPILELKIVMLLDN